MRMLDLVDVVRKRDLLCGLFEVDFFLGPGDVVHRPGLHSCRRSSSVPQEELRQPVSGTQLVLFGREPRPYEIPQRLVCGIRDPHRCQVAGTVVARELRRVPAIGFHTVASFHRYQRRRYHLAFHPEFRKLPVQCVPRRPRFVAGPQLIGRPELLQQLSHRLQPVGDDTQGPDLTVSPWLRDRDSDRFRVDIQTDKPYIFHDRLLSHVALRHRFNSESQRNPRSANSEPVVPL